MKIVYVIFLIVIITGCSNNKKYKYIEIKQQQIPTREKIEKEEEAITAPNDSIAYCEAYKKFCISAQVFKRNKNQDNTYAATADIPHSFKLLNEKGTDIAFLYHQLISDSLHRVLEIQVGYIRDN